MILLAYCSRHRETGKSGRNCWTWHVSKKIPDSAAFSYVRIRQTSSVCQAQTVI